MKPQEDPAAGLAPCNSISSLFKNLQLMSMEENYNAYKYVLIFCIYNIYFQSQARKYPNNACHLFNLMFLKIATA